MFVDPAGRAHHVWVSRAGDTPSVRYAVDDGPAETIAVTNALGALDALHVDTGGEVVVAFTRGGARGPNRHSQLPFRLRVGVRSAGGDWSVVDHDVPERARGGWLAVSGATRWFLWQRAWPPEEPGPWAVDLTTGVEVHLAPDDPPDGFNAMAAWVGADAALHVLGVRDRRELVHRTRAAGHAEPTWSEREVIASRDGSLEGDVFYPPSTVQDDLRVASGPDGTVHLWAWRKHMFSFELVHARWSGGPTWTEDAVETVYTPTPDDPTVRGLSYVHAFAVGRDGTVRAVAPGTLADDPNEKLFVALVGTSCATACAD